MEEIKRAIHFDERRKILSVKTEENKDAMVGEVNGGKLIFTSSADYNEEGIKMILGNARSMKEKAEKLVPMLQDRINEIEEDMSKNPISEMTPDLKELEDKLKKIKTIKDREPKAKELDNLKASLKNAEENLKNASKDINEIRQEIGGRLSL